MDFEVIMLNKMGQAEKDKYCIILMWNLKKTKEKKKQAHRYRKQVSGQG